MTSKTSRLPITITADIPEPHFWGEGGLVWVIFLFFTAETDINWLSFAAVIAWMNEFNLMRKKHDLLQNIKIIAFSHFPQLSSSKTDVTGMMDQVTQGEWNLKVIPFIACIAHSTSINYIAIQYSWVVLMLDHYTSMHSHIEGIWISYSMSSTSC